MHAPGDSTALPAGVDPIPVPDSRREAEMLVFLLDAGLYPKCREAASLSVPKEYEQPGEGAAEPNLAAELNL